MTPSAQDHAIAALSALGAGTRAPHASIDVHRALVSVTVAFAALSASGRKTVPSWRALLEAPCLGPTLRLGVETAAALRTSDEALQTAWNTLLDVDAERLGTVYEGLCTVRLDAQLRPAPSLERKRAGSHYTPPELALRVAELTLAPLLARAATRADVLALRVCDPAAGAGAFLLAAARVIARRLMELGASDERAAMRTAAEACLRGVDRDPIALDLSRAALWIACEATPPTAALRVGDALLDESLEWPRAFADVWAARGGFDAFVGNPPWISYAGRAAQPIEPAHKALLGERYAAFSGYRNLQGVFVERCARLLAPGGRLGLLVPSSMSEQAGYAPSRAAHDGYCECDLGLADLGDSFEGVFQPCMALVSTRRATPREGSPAPWPMERPDVDDLARGILAKLAELPRLPAQAFGERGVQSSGDDTLHMKDEQDATHTAPLRAGGDISAFMRGPAGAWAAPAWFGARLRPDAFAQVAFVVRQTARYPIACLSDGLGFRNSLLAGFAVAPYSAEALVAWLNSSAVRYDHYTRTRDARQGMPQVKIGHLRALPAPPDAALSALHSLGSELSVRNQGLAPDDQARLDALVGDHLGLEPRERARIRDWAATTR